MSTYINKSFLILFFILNFDVLIYSLDWPQLQNNPERTGYQSETLSTPVSNVWVKGFGSTEEERLYPAVQPVIVNGRVYIGTEMGTFYCLNGTTGNTIWEYPAAGQSRIGPIIGTAGVENNTVFFGSQDGFVYALNTADGSVKWKFPSVAGFRIGFSNSVLLAENKVFIARRDGVYFCLDQATGNKVWERNIGAYVLMASCYDTPGGNGRLFFGAMDMKVYALNTSNGSIAWSSDRLVGRMFTDFWPVAYHGVVVIRLWKMLNPGAPAYLSFVSGTLPSSEMTKQDTMIISIENDPFTYKDMYIFDQVTGTEQPTVAQWAFMGMSNTAPIGSIDRDGYLITPVGVKTWPSAWGRLDINPLSSTYGKIVEVLTDGTTGDGNCDETMNASCAGNLVFSLHFQETNAHSVPAHVFNLDTKTWTSINPAYYDDGYFTSITQSGGTPPAAISNKYIYHNTWSNLNCRLAQ